MWFFLDNELEDWLVETDKIMVAVPDTPSTPNS